MMVVARARAPNKKTTTSIPQKVFIFTFRPGSSTALSSCPSIHPNARAELRSTHCTVIALTDEQPVPDVYIQIDRPKPKYDKRVSIGIHTINRGVIRL